MTGCATTNESSSISGFDQIIETNSQGEMSIIRVHCNDKVLCYGHDGCVIMTDGLYYKYCVGK